MSPKRQIKHDAVKASLLKRRARMTRINGKAVHKLTDELMALALGMTMEQVAQIRRSVQ